MNSKAGKRYMQAVGKNMVCTAQTRRALLHDMDEDVSEYCMDNPGVTIVVLESHFGKAEKIAAEFMSDVEDDEIDRVRKRKRMVDVIVVLLVSIIVLALTVRYFYLHPIYDTIETVIYKPEPAPDNIFDENFVE